MEKYDALRQCNDDAIIQFACIELNENIAWKFIRIDANQNGFFLSIVAAVLFCVFVAKPPNKFEEYPIFNWIGLKVNICRFTNQ